MRHFNILFLVLALISVSSARAQSISQYDHDLGSVKQVRLSSGRVSVILFPESLLEVKIGAPQILKVITSKSDPRELTFFWTSNRSYRTNMIVRTTRNTFVFEVEPSVHHQDFLKIRSAYGAPYDRTSNSSSKSAVGIRR